MTAPISAQAFAPADPAPAPAQRPTEFHASRRADGWSAANQRRFLEAIAGGHAVEAAAAHVGLSTASAYAFRRTAKGASFALGWRAATLVARDVVADTLMNRALDGQVDTLTRADGSTVTRHRHDNRLALSLLARLDRQVEAAPDADAKAARLVAQEFDAFLDLVGADAGPARAGLFLARRSAGLLDDGVEPDASDLSPIFTLAAADRMLRTGVATAGEVDVHDLDPAARAGWTAEQWMRADAAGLLAFAAPSDPASDAPVDPAPHTASADCQGAACQHSQHWPAFADMDEGEELDSHVWYSQTDGAWGTDFPPPPGFQGWQVGAPDDADYFRALTEEEAALAEFSPERRSADQQRKLAEDYQAWRIRHGAGRVGQGLDTARPAAADADPDDPSDADPLDWRAYAAGAPPS